MDSPEYLQQMSDSELIKYQAGWKIESENYLLAEREWQRRTMLKQHELDFKLIKDQIKWSRFSAIIGVVATLAGATLGAYLQHKFPPQPTKDIKQPIQSTISTSKSVSHKEKVLLSPLSSSSKR